jgi:cytochrome c-type biogenesis protein CcmH/NrfG
MRAAQVAAADGEMARAEALLARVGEDDRAAVVVARALVRVAGGQEEAAETALRALAERVHPREVEARVNGGGYGFLQAEKLEVARAVFALNTRLFPEAANTWDSLGEVHMRLGNGAEAVRHYRKSLELNPENENAKAMIARIEGEAEAAE